MKKTLITALAVILAISCGEDKTQQPLEKSDIATLADQWLENNIIGHKFIKDYANISTQIIDTSWAVPTAENDRTVDALTRDIASDCDSIQNLPMKDREAVIQDVMIKKKLLKNYIENNRVQDGWVLEHKFRFNDKDFSMNLLLNNEKTEIVRIVYPEVRNE